MVDTYEAPGDAATDPEPQQAPTTPTTPSLPDDASALGGYESVEAMASALASAEQKITELGQAAGAPVGSVEELFAQAVQEHAAGGQVTEATSAALEKAGISKTMQNQAVADRTAAAQMREQSVLGWFGGEEGYKEFEQWVPGNMEPAEIKAVNSMLDGVYAGDDATQAKLVVSGLMARFKGGEARVVSGVPNLTQGGPKPFANKWEAMKIIQSQEYKSGDRHVHADYQKRLAASEPGLFS